MKILVVCQYYYPEPFRIADICEELTRRGHEVLVVTGVPNYPEGMIYPGYENSSGQDEERNGVRIHHCWTIPRKRGSLFRLLNYFSFPISSRKYVLSKECAAQDGGEFDVVFVNQLSPVLMAEAGIAYQKKHEKKLVLYCLDLWPESLAAGGIRENSVIYRFFRFLSNRVYRKCDRILVTSRMFIPHLMEAFQIPESRLSYLPQYAEAMFDRVPPAEPREKLHLVFTGNIGRLQDIDTILKAADRLRGEPVHFHIVGDGSEYERLCTIVKEQMLDNVTMHGRRPIDEMTKFYRTADALLVTMKPDPVLSLTLPGKMQAYLAAARPIIGAIDGEAANVIREAGCGYAGPAGDTETLCRNIRIFMMDTERREMGKRAREYYEAHFSKACFFETLEQELAGTLIQRRNSTVQTYS